MFSQKFFQKLSSAVEVACCALRIALHVFDVLNVRVNRGSEVKVGSRSRPLAFAIIGVCASEHVDGLARVKLHGRSVFRDRSVPVAYVEILAPQQVMKIRVALVAFDSVLEFYDGVGVVAALARYQAKAYVCLGWRGGDGCGF